MIIVFFVIGALALLVTVLLFGFVGCGAIAGLDNYELDVTDDYPSAIFATASTTGNLVAYWRLGEPTSLTVPSAGGAAKSQVGGYDGDYGVLAPVMTPDNQRFSDKTPGKIILGSPGLLKNQNSTVTNTCVNFDGGFVQVPFDDHLNPGQFTLEAWVFVPMVTGEYYRCLVESTGSQGLGPKLTGWGLYLGPKDNPPDPNNLVDAYWQVWMGDGTNFNRVAVANNPVKAPNLAYLVLTFDGKRLLLFLYYPDTGQGVAQSDTLALRANVAKFQRNDTSKAGQGDFFIGAGNNLFPSAGLPSQRLYPFKGQIQEVTLYNVSLVQGPCQNQQTFDCQGYKTLVTHELSGGNV
jgi:hypothetical protein